MATPRELKEVWELMTAAFPGNKATDATAAIYAATLKDLDGAILKAAALECITACEFFPTVFKLRQYAARIITGADSQPPALVAWGQVKRAVDRYGRGWTPEFDEPIITHAVNALGWFDFCNSDLDQEMSWRARFVEIYDQLTRRQVETARQLPEVKQISSERSALVNGKVKQLTEGWKK